DALERLARHAGAGAYEAERRPHVRAYQARPFGNARHRGFARRKAELAGKSLRQCIGRHDRLGGRQPVWLSAAEAIMTTDTLPKAFSRKLRLSTGEATVTGIAKGAGLIRPDMGTPLGFVCTGAGVPREALERV